jgi:predicted aspartyl protease
MSSSFTFKLPYLREKGPLCKIVVKPSEPTIANLKLQKKKIPSRKILALIDTGASTTAISQRLVKELGLVPRGTAKVYTSSRHSEMRNEYDISLEFGKDIYLQILRALEADFKNYNIDCLIGRDILQHGKLVYDGPNNRVILTF